MPTLKQRLSYLILGQKGGQNRIQIIELLKDRPYNLNQLAEILNLNYRTVKHHTDILLKNELVSTSKTGGYGEVYFLTPELEGNIELFEEIVGKFSLSKKLKDFTSSPKFFQSVMEQTNDGVIIINKEGSVFFWNKSAEKLLGYKEEEILDDTSQVFREIGIQDEMIKKVENGEQIVAFETKLKQKSGKLMDVNLTMDGIKDENDNLIGFSILFRDITDRKRAEVALRESKARYKELSDSISDVFFAMDTDLRYTYWNKASENLTKISAKDALGKSIFDIFPDHEETRKVVAAYREVLKTQQSKIFMTEYQLGGKYYVFEISAYPSRTGLSVFVKDITDRKRAEEALRESEERYRHLFENSPIGIVLSSVDGKVVTSNKAMEVITEYPLEELKKIKMSDVYVNPEYRKKLVEIINREGRVVNFPAQLKRKDGAAFDALLNVSRVNTRSEDFLQTICIDVTERKHNEEALRLSEERYALALRAASIGSWDWDILKGGLHWSETIEPMFGFGHGEFGATYEAFLDCIHPEDRQHVVDSVNACIENGKDYAIEHRIVWPDGTIRTVSETGDVIRDENGKAIRMLGVVRDITERKRAEDALRESREHYHNLFENFPISLWEEDFTEVKRHIDSLRSSGIRNFRAYFQDHPKDVANCARLVKIVDVNKNALVMYQAENKEQLLGNLDKVFNTESYDVFREELIAIADGKTTFESEAITRTLRGNKVYVRLKLAVAPGYEDTLSRVLVSIIDISERKRA